MSRTAPLIIPARAILFGASNHCFSTKTPISLSKKFHSYSYDCCTATESMNKILGWAARAPAQSTSARIAHNKTKNK